MCHGSMGPPSYYKAKPTAIRTSIWASTNLTTAIGVHPRPLDDKAVDPMGGHLAWPVHAALLSSTNLQHAYQNPPPL